MKRMASILVVDDDTLTLDLLTIVLRRHGYLFSVAKDGAEALKLCLWGSITKSTKTYAKEFQPYLTV
jgi:CheY-like chemotaxis protein